ncbi:MAG TPA: diacylglycerol kinase [Gammaproteobacteria bacterium]
MADGLRGIPRLLRAARVTFAGLRAAAVHEEAFRIELFGFVVLAPLGLWLGDSGVERALLVGSLLFVLAVELLNSSIEATVDRVGFERHELSGRAKDLGSAAVFVALVNAAVVWMLVLCG